MTAIHNVPDWVGKLLLVLCGGIAGSLLTAFVTPRIQHAIWKKRRWAETMIQLRLKSMERFNELTTELDRTLSQDTGHRLDPNWATHFRANAEEIMVLFPSNLVRERLAALSRTIFDSERGIIGKSFPKDRVSVLKALHAKAFDVDGFL